MSSGMSGATLRADAVDVGTSAVLPLPSAAVPAALWLTNRRGRSSAAAGASAGSGAGDDMRPLVVGVRFSAS